MLPLFFVAKGKMMYLMTLRLIMFQVSFNLGKETFSHHRKVPLPKTTVGFELADKKKNSIYYFNVVFKLPTAPSQFFSTSQSTTQNMADSFSVFLP